MKTYLGDGLYAEYDGYQIVLTAENGLGVTNTVYLEPDVYTALVRYHEELTDAQLRARVLAFDGLCEDCPPIGYPNNKTRCNGCPRWARSLDLQDVPPPAPEGE